MRNLRFLAPRLACLVLLVTSSAASLAACEGDDEPAAPDAGVGSPDATPPEPPDAAPAPDAVPLHGYGEFCIHDGDCASRRCFEALCTKTCDPGEANTCRDVEAFCASTHDTRFACQGRVVTGDDVGDDAILAVDEDALGKLSPAGDADLFELRLEPGSYRVTATPAADGDIGVEVYSELTKMEANVNDGGVAAEETARFLVPVAQRYFVVVRDVANAPATYHVHVTKAD
jgi:hypothetical protein